MILFAPPGQRERIGTFTGVVLVCEDIRQTFSSLAAKGVVFSQEPKKEAWGKWWATLEDPDRNTFGLGQANEG